MLGKTPQQGLNLKALELGQKIHSLRMKQNLQFVFKVP
jgi:hypothetical protein